MQAGSFVYVFLLYIYYRKNVIFSASLIAVTAPFLLQKTMLEKGTDFHFYFLLLER